MAGSQEPTPTADESAAVAANMAGDSVEGGLPGSDADLAGEPGTMSEREVAGRRGDEPSDDLDDDRTDEPADGAP